MKEVSEDVVAVTYHDPCHLGRRGGVKTAMPSLATTIGATRLEMVMETGAETMVPCCPWCEQNIEDSIKTGDIPSWKVRDLVDMVAAALD